MAEVWTPKYRFEEPSADNAFMEFLGENVIPGLNNNVTQAIGDDLLRKLAVAPTPEQAWMRRGEQSHQHSPDLYNVQNTLKVLISYLSNSSVDPRMVRHFLDSFIDSVNHTVAFCAASHERTFNEETKNTILCGQTLSLDLNAAVGRLETALADMMKPRAVLAEVSEEAGSEAREVLAPADEPLRTEIHELKRDIVTAFSLTELGEILNVVRASFDRMRSELDRLSDDLPDLKDRLEVFGQEFDTLDRELGNPEYHQNDILADYLMKLGALNEYLDASQK